jgi:hypothetical protein
MKSRIQMFGTEANGDNGEAVRVSSVEALCLLRYLLFKSVLASWRETLTNPRVSKCRDS